ncbi:MAG: NTE family protein [Myxococcota bacterium]|jgi:NTE family protein
MDIDFERPIGLALGSGAARGWSHIGVLRALNEAGIEPEIVSGSSAGAVVGAFYAANQLDAFESWVRKLDRRQIMGYLDPTLRGGLLRTRKIFDALSEHLPDRPIESLPRQFSAVAADLSTGREVWLRDGSLMAALRASIALPGLVKPEYLHDSWLVDGGLVNPVPVSLCRAMGARSVIAVDLNTTLLGRRFSAIEQPGVVEPEVNEIEQRKEADGVLVRAVIDALDDDALPLAPVGIKGAGGLLSSPRAARFISGFQGIAADLLDQFGFEESAEPSGPATPSIYEVITNSINIMQTRIGRSRLAGDPPELLITPRLQDFGLLEFDRANEAIAIGRRAVAHALAAR